MVPTETIDRITDPVEVLREAIDDIWIAACKAYDVTTCMPDMQTLFAGADLSRPNVASEAVLVVMLQEVIESEGRFSPWYKQPARAFGLTSMRDSKTNQMRWMLAPEAIQRWQVWLTPLAIAIRKYSGLIHAMILVDDLMMDIDSDPCIAAVCNCIPPHSIQIRRSVLDKSEIICECCLHPYVYPPP
jgi:hypothetical protein